MQHKADPNLTLGELSPPLCIATQLGHEGFVRLLLGHGADVAKANSRGLKPLTIACQNFHDSKILRLLLEANASPHNDPPSYPLHSAVEGGSTECIALLIEAGVDLDAKDSKKKTPLHLAIDKESSLNTIVLLKKGADATIPHPSGIPLLHLAITKKMWNVIIPLIEARAYINALDAEGKTPLYRLCEGHMLNKDQIPLVRDLLKKGADVNIQFNGMKPLELAKNNENLELISLFIDHGDRLPS